MFLSDFSIRRPLAAVVIVLMLMALGLLALQKLRVNEIPDVEQPVLVVQIAYPGASPETVEREVINRLERAMQGISGIYEVRSTAKDGSAVIVLIFNFSKNMIEAADDVRNAISTVRYKLPLEMREPVIRRQDPSAQPVIEMALSSTTQSHAVLSRKAEDDLADRLRAIEGVATVTVTGSLRRELSVLLRADRLREYGISVTEVVDAVRSQNANAPVGRVVGPLKEESIRLVGRIENPAEFQQIIVRRRGNEIVRLGQLAETVDGFADVESHALRNGRPNVSLSVTRSREASTVAVAARVRQLVDQIQGELPN